MIHLSIKSLLFPHFRHNHQPTALSHYDIFFKSTVEIHHVTGYMRRQCVVDPLSSCKYRIYDEYNKNNVEIVYFNLHRLDLEKKM